MVGTHPGLPSDKTLFLTKHTLCNKHLSSLGMPTMTTVRRSVISLRLVGGPGQPSSSMKATPQCVAQTSTRTGTDREDSTSRLNAPSNVL